VPVARPAQPPNGDGAVAAAGSTDVGIMSAERVISSPTLAGGPNMRDWSIVALAGVGLFSLGALLALGMALDPDLNPFAKNAPPQHPNEVALQTPREPPGPAAGQPARKGPALVAPRPVVPPGGKLGGGDAKLNPDGKAEMKVEPPMIQPLPKVEP